MQAAASSRGLLSVILLQNPADSYYGAMRMDDPPSDDPWPRTPAPRTRTDREV